MIKRLYLTVVFSLLLAPLAMAEMTPQEQMLAVALQGEEASIRAATEGMTMVRAALEALVHNQDAQISDLQAQVAKLRAEKPEVKEPQ
jgi:TolA-binding protein